MAGTCRHLCERFYPQKTYMHQNWVEQGFRKCMPCKFHVITQDIRCRCCVQKFRTKVRSGNHSQKYYRENTKPKLEQERDIIIRWKQNRYTDNINKD